MLGPHHARTPSTAPLPDPPGLLVRRDKDGDVRELASAVVALALKARTKDDVTALVVRIWPADEWEMRSPTKNLDDGEGASFVS